MIAHFCFSSFSFNNFIDPFTFSTLIVFDVYLDGAYSIINKLITYQKSIFIRKIANAQDFDSQDFKRTETKLMVNI